MIEVADIAALDLESMGKVSPRGVEVVLADVDLGVHFSPRAAPVRFWRFGKATGVLVPAAVEYLGTDVRLRRTGLVDDWRVLHVGPTSFAECAGEFVNLIKGVGDAKRPKADMAARQNASRDWLVASKSRAPLGKGREAGVLSQRPAVHGALAKFKIGDRVRHRQNADLVFQVVEILEPVPLRPGDHLIGCVLESDVHKYHEDDLVPIQPRSQKIRKTS